MKTLLIYGVESVAGANIAHTLSDRYNVIGVAIGDCPEIEHCQILSGEASLEPPDQLITDIKPDYVLDATCCGDSSWNPHAEIGDETQCNLAVERAAVCKQLAITYALLSSDAIFTGPWMFHEEDSEYSCTSSLGKRLVKLEADVQKACPDSFIVRTHVFGWNWLDGRTGWVEGLLQHIQNSTSQCQGLSQPGYATPILANELALILARGFEESLSGTFHICGAERVNRQQFARKLAELCNINWLSVSFHGSHFSQEERRQFGCGEMSLQTRHIRKALCVAMPTLTESITSLIARQPIADFQDQLIAGNIQYSRAA